MEVHPPWASELLARNRKVARSIVWSTSLDAGLSSHLYPSPDAQIPQECGPSRRSTSNLISRSTAGVMKMTRDERGKVVQLNPSASRPLGSEKSVNIKQREGSADEEVGYNSDNMKEKNNGEESFLEYGPGIVRKLRSRYQSLALRQYSGRPSLRRSTSLENILDAATDPCQSSTTPSPVPYNSNGDQAFENGHHHNEETRRPEVNYIRNGVVSSIPGGEYDGNKYVNRSRQQGYGDYNRKDRMRRARSVDALHRGSKREEEEREIFEKFKTVVLPKEEIVIIEVSKPRANLSSDIYGKYYGIEDKLASSSSPLANTTQLSHSRSSPPPHTLPISNGHYSSELNRVRSLASPEHELPPPDIVRETARIFEKNTDNTLSPTPNNPTSNHLISNFKKVGHALRLNKSCSVSPSSSPLPSPTVPNSKIIMNGGQNQNGIPSYHHSQNKSHLLQASATAKSHEPNSVNPIKSSVASPKQVGIIRPTVASSPNPNPGTPINAKSISNPSLNNASPAVPASKKVPVPEVSPILRASDRNFVSDNKALSHIKKPPLSPKPIYTSSPKNIFLIHNNTKNGPSKMTETNVTTSGSTNTKSFEDVPMKMESVDRKIPVENNVPSPPTHALAQSRTSLPSSGGGVAKNNRPSEKENKNVMEFQQIALKPVAKPEPNDNVVMNNNIKNTNNSTTTPIPPISEPKTERKQDSSNALVAKPQIVASTMKTHPTPAPRTVAPPPEKPKEPPQSQLRTHQKQVSEKKKQASTAGTMVFDFTKRSTVPDYIEDDGLHRRITLGGTVTDESHDDDLPNDFDQVDSKLIQFEGANIIINGRSSIQKRPKSQKLNISINEDVTITFEYPSEASILATDEQPSDNILVHKTPNLTTGSELGNYTSTKVGNTYQLGNYENKKAAPPAPLKKQQDDVDELIEDYLRPDKESTTWSNEIGADILF